MSNLYRAPSKDASYQCFISFGQAVSEKKLFQKSTNKKQELPMMAMFVNGSKRNEQFLQRTFHRCFLPRFGPFGQAVSEQKIFRNRPIRNKNCMWRPCLLIDRDKMGNLYREPSIDASYQVSVHLAKRFRGQHFQKSINQKQELPMVAIFVNGSGRNMQSLQRTSHRCILLSFGSFGKAVSEEKIFQKSTNQKQELSVVAMFVNGSGRNEQS